MSSSAIESGIRSVNQCLTANGSKTVVLSAEEMRTIEVWANSVGDEDKYFKRAEHPHLARSTEVKEGHKLIHFNQTAKMDTLVGKGEFKKAKFSLDLTERRVLVRLTRFQHRLVPPQQAGEQKIQEEASFMLHVLKGIEGVVQIAFPPTTFRSKDGLEKTEILIPYYSRGDLSKIIYPDTFEVKAAIFKQVLTILSSLHKRGIAHGDVSWSNILLDETLSPTLADFAVSKLLPTAEFDKIAQEDIERICKMIKQYFSSKLGLEVAAKVEKLVKEKKESLTAEQLLAELFGPV